MICSHCHKSFKAVHVEAQRGKGFTAQIQCPLCGAWLGRSPMLGKLKLVGFYLGVVALLTAWQYVPWRGIAILVAGFCLMLLLVTHMMDQLIVQEAPEAEDKSHERQKYR